MDSTSDSIPLAPDDATELNKLALRVYLLSIFLYRQQVYALPNSDSLSSLDAVRNTDASSLGKALNRIAILLTRGTTEEKTHTIAVAAGPLMSSGINARVIRGVDYTVASPPSTLLAHTSQDEALDTSSGGAATSLENATTMTPPAPHSASLSTTKLPDPNLLASAGTNIRLDGEVAQSQSECISTAPDSVVFHSSSRYDFYQFARLFFLVIRAAGQNRAILPAAYFSVSQCSAKILARCEVVVTKYLLPELKAWLPGHDEAVESMTVDINDETAQRLLFNSGLIGQKSRTSANSTTYTFDHGNAHLWLLVLLKRVENFQESVRYMHESHSKTTVQDATYSSLLLHQYLSLIPASLWAIRSLDVLLRDLRCRRGVASLERKVMDEQDEIWLVEEPTGNKAKEKKKPQTLLPGCLAFIQAINGITTWTTSAQALANSRFARSDLPLHYSIFDVPHHGLDKLDAPMQEALNHWVSVFPELEEEKEKIVVDLNNGKSLGGTCHCEASIMGDEDVARSAPNSNDKHSPIVLGASKKSCPFCWMLGKALEQTRGIEFSLPGAHGYYFPWIPPVSVSHDVLLELESQAQQRLRDILDAGRSPVSGTHNSGGDEDEDELLVMELNAEIEARHSCADAS